MLDSELTKTKLGTFIWKCVLLGIMLSGMLATAEYWASRMFPERNQFKYMEITHPKVDADAIILGDSETEAGVNPKFIELTNLRTYNFAFVGSYPYFYKKWYTLFFKKYYRKPKLILYFVDYFMLHNYPGKRFEQDSQYFPWDFFLNCLADNDLSKKYLLMNRSVFINRRLNVLYALLGHAHDFKYNYIYQNEKSYNGFIPHFDTTPDWAHKPIEEWKQKSLMPEYDREMILNTFSDLLDQFTKDGIKIIVIYSPQYLSDSVYVREEVKNTSDLFSQFCKRKNIDYLDYNSSKSVDYLNYEKDNFYNVTHLSEIGADIFSALLLHDLYPILKPIIPLNVLNSHQTFIYKGEDVLFDVFNTIGESYAMHQDYSKALAAIHNSLQLKPQQNIRAYKISGDIYFILKDYSKALKAYRIVLESNPNDSITNFKLGNTFYNMGNYEESIKFYDAAYKLDPSSTGVSNIITDNYLKLGNNYFTKGDLSKARIFYQKSIQLNNNLPPTVYNDFGNILLMITKNPNQAVPYFLKAISLDSNFVDAYYNLGNSYLQLKEFQKALSCYQKVLLLNPNYPDVRQSIAMAQYIMNHPDIQVNIKSR